MRFELYRDVKGEWRWRCVADNSRIVADSGEGYKRRVDALRMLNRLRERGKSIRVYQEKRGTKLWSLLYDGTDE